MTRNTLPIDAHLLIEQRNAILDRLDLLERDDNAGDLEGLLGLCDAILDAIEDGHGGFHRQAIVTLDVMPV